MVKMFQEAEGQTLEGSFDHVPDNVDGIQKNAGQIKMAYGFASHNVVVVQYFWGEIQ